MATLYEISQQTRRITLLALIIIIVILVIDNVSKFLESQVTPFTEDISCYALPNDILGTFPEPTIPSLAITDEASPTFLVDGAFTPAPDTVLVYSIEKPREKLDTVSDAEQTAKDLGFSPNNLTTNGNELIWENTEKTRSLRFNKLSQTWRMRTQYFQDTIALQRKDLLATTQEYVAAASSLISTIGFNEKSISSGTKTAIFSKLGADGLFTAPVAGTGADYVTLDVYRSLAQTSVIARNSLPEAARDLCDFDSVDADVYTSDPRVGSLHMVVSDKARDAMTEVYEVDFIDYEYNYSTVGTKSIVTPAEAWDRVTTGEGSLTLLRVQGKDTFANYETVGVSSFTANAQATKVAYYEPEVWDGYVYPIYIFEGVAQLTDGRIADFVFYVDALTRINLDTE